MQSWNVESINGSRRAFYLMNRTGTRIIVDKRARDLVDLPYILTRMEELGVPISYTENLEEIKFAPTDKLVLGEYQDDQIFMSTESDARDSMDRTLVHELGHHVDDYEAISDDPDVRRERQAGIKFLSLGNKTAVEFVACAFEHYYLSSPEHRRLFKQACPKVFRTLDRLHRRYSQM